MNKRLINILNMLSFLALGTYVFMLMFPFFYDVNVNTNVVNNKVYGYQIGFGDLNRGDSLIKGDIFSEIVMILGAISFVMEIVFFVWFLCSKRKNTPMMYFIKAFSIFSICLIISSLFLSWLIHQRLNATNMDRPIFTWEFFVSVGVSLFALVVDLYTIVYIAINKSK